ncbi:MAG: hypothetical protein HY054_00150 [Proteobacteria bacterium]|nr:hypothetical protein [Pseudomonadota bacterium]
MVAAAAIAAIALLVGFETRLAVTGGALDDNIVGTLLVTFAVILITSSTIGAAIHILAVRLNLRSIWFYLLAAALAGAALALLLQDKILATSFSMSAWTLTLRAQIVALGALPDLITATAFWLIRRPDRDAPANPASTAP